MEVIDLNNLDNDTSNSIKLNFDNIESPPSSSNNLPSVNFGGGIELLMNDKKKNNSDSKDNVLDEIDNLDSIAQELDDLSDIKMGILYLDEGFYILKAIGDALYRTISVINSTDFSSSDAGFGNRQFYYQASYAFLAAKGAAQ